MTSTVKRALISVAVAAVIYLMGDIVLGSPVYDANIKALEYLAAVIGGGCCWIGSNEKL